MTELIHDRARDLLVYRASADLTRQVLAAVPEARAIDGQYVAVPHCLRSAQVLRWLDLPIPPLLTDENYDWPIQAGRKPLAHQRVMTNFLVAHPRCFNLSDMGAMKTLAALWAADWLMRQQPGVKCLLVCPLSTIDVVWGRAIFSTFLTRRTFEVLHGDAERRIERLAKPADFYVVNHDGVGVGARVTKKRSLELTGFSKALAERSDIQIAIVDEASAYRDSQTLRHRVARLVLGQRPYLWLLTGTPTPNAPTDAYGLARLVNGAMGKSFKSFRDETMVQVSNFRWVPRRDGYERARRLLAPSVRFDIRDVWDGPPMTTQQRQVELSDEQKALMHRLKRDLQVAIRGKEPISAVNEAAARTKFIQISLGAVYDEDHGVHLVDAAPRMSELVEVLKQLPGKALVFAPLTSIVNLLHRTLGKRWSTEMVTGATGQAERARIFGAFQEAEDPRLIVADPGCMAHGLDLYAAQAVIFFGPTDKSELYQQAVKRAHRPGQKYPVTVVQLCSNPLEREIYRRLENSQSMQGALLDAVRRGEL